MNSRNHTFTHAVVFVLGFGLVFTLLGLSVGVIGRLVAGALPLIQRIGGVVRSSHLVCYR